MIRLHQLQERDLFLIPCWYVLAGLILGYFVPHINYRFFPWFIAPLDHAVVVTFLSSVSTGMMALTGIIFSLILLFITFGSTAYSPRVVGAFANTGLLHAIGIFSGTFIYTLMGLRAEGQLGLTAGTSALMLWIALAWILASLVVLFRVLTVAWRITATPVLFRLGREGLREIARVYPPSAAAGEVTVGEPAESGQQAPVTQSVIYRGMPEYLLALDTERLVAMAGAADAVIRIPFAIDDAIMDGDLLALVHSSSSTISETGFRRAIVLGQERTIKYSPKYAIRLLVDIAIRALSPAVNDPTTAVQSLDQIEALLQALGNSQLDIGKQRDADGVVRLIYLTPTWDDYLTLGLLEIMQYGSNSLQVERRLGAILHHLLHSVPEVRRPAVTRLIEERLAVIQRAIPDPIYRAHAEQHDRQGLAGGE